MWTPPADELVQTPQQPPVSAGAWTPPQEELVGGSSATPEDPGLLKSAAAGLMSGVPLAESAVAGLESLSPDKTYEQAHQELENLRDRAWDAHPVAYGAGKTAGMVGTGIAAPAGIPGAIAVGAGSGLDAAANIQDMPKAIAEGAAMGGVLGTIGEKVISPLINKVLPATAKTALGALGPGKEAVEARLANREAIEGALTNPEASAKLAEGMNALTGKADDLSEAARGLLDPKRVVVETPGKAFAPGRGSVLSGEAKGLDEALVSPFEKPASQSNPMLGTADEAFTPGGQAAETIHFPSTLEEGPRNPATGIRGPSSGTPGGDVVVTPGRGDIEAPRPSSRTIVTPGGDASNVMGVMKPVTPDSLTPIFDQVKARFSQNGVANTPANESALKALDAQYQRMIEVAQANGGKLSETDLKQQIVALQSMLKKNVFDNPDVSVTKEALKELSGALNGALKGSNPAYGEAMKPVADLRGQITDLKDTFKPDYGEAGQFTGSDTMNSRLGGILKENKSNAQEMLQKLSDLTGFDFLGNAKNLQYKQAFEKGGSGGAFSPLSLLLGTLGFGAGKATGIPMGGAAGAAVGHFASRAVDGGQIAKSVIDAWLNAGQKLTDSGAQAALEKYGPMLAQAAKAGGTQLAATHFVLATSHPEYQHLITQFQDQ